MYIMYVDESGDPGLVNSPSKYFALSGLVVHELRWLEILDSLIQFKRSLNQSIGLRFREEIHAANWISKPSTYMKTIPRHIRYYMLSLFALHVSTIGDLTFINVIVDKSKRTPPFDTFDFAWRMLLQRFDNTISHQNFNGPGSKDERGMLIADSTNEAKLRLILRKMRRFNYVPSKFTGHGYPTPVKRIVEDAVMRDSAQSLFVQVADLAAFSLYQFHAPSTYMRQKSRNNLFKTLSPLFCSAAAPSNPPYFIVSY